MNNTDDGDTQKKEKKAHYIQAPCKFSPHRQ